MCYNELITGIAGKTLQYNLQSFLAIGSNPYSSLLPFNFLSNDSETNNLSFTSQHFTSLFLAIYLRLNFFLSLNTW